MDYEKKYNEAVCNIQKLLENGRKEGEVICAYEADFMSIFPELKESEDERIRKGLIEYFKDFRLGTFAYLEPKKIIDWLEKQGTPAKLSEEEQNRFAKGVLTSCALSFIDYLDAHKCENKMCVSNGECEDIENAFHNAMWDRLHRYYCKYIEKQGEHKAVEDSITLEEFKNAFITKAKQYDIDLPNRSWDINALCKELYSLKHQSWQGEHRQNTNYPKFDLDDVLALQCCMETVKKVQEDNYLYKQLEGLHGKIYDAYYFEKYGEKAQGESALEAIKEEKVDNANKVEPKDYNGIDPHFGKPTDKVEQKPVWSEEEKKKLDRIYYILGIAADEHAYSNTCRLIGDKEAIELQDFLRSIAKPEQKSDWSEDDEKYVKDLAAYFTGGLPLKYAEEDIANWFKSLKDRIQPQNTWKPSDEQMEALEEATHIVGSKYKSCLASLYQELKKLREE